MIHLIRKNKYLQRYYFVPLLLTIALVLTSCGGADPEGAPEESIVDGEAPDVAVDEILSPTGSGLCANQYLPVVEGATWTYEGTEDTLGIYEFTSTIINVRGDGFTWSNNFTDLLQEQEWACTPEGLLALQYNRGAAASVTVAGSETNFETDEVTGLTLPREISVGDIWEHSFTISGTQTMPGDLLATTSGIVMYKSEALGEESVSVKAGDFDAIKMRIEISFDLEITMDDVVLPTLFEAESIVWYAPGVGWVKSEDRGEIFGVESLSSIELISYSIP